IIIPKVAAKPGAYIIDCLVGIIMSVINAMASLPLTEVFAGEPIVLFAVCFVCLILVYAISVGTKKIRALFSVAAIFVTILCSGVVLSFGKSSQTTDTAGIRFDVLDVGQGQCIVATSGESCVVIDCGGDEPADMIAISHLSSRGITNIDALVLTHAHADHANGAEYLMRAIETKSVYMPATDRENAVFIEIENNADKACNTVFVDVDTTIQLDGMKIKLLTLPAGSDENENGLVVLVCDGEYEALITGDIATSNEKLIIDRIPDCESYIVGHHGSKTSSSQALLNRALPELSVISVGVGNTYGHPSPQAMKRLHNIGSEIRRTDTEGTLTFYSRDTEAEE
ncbi:MAG: MBL fold metallo-hydrolase, partial [Oscillospiraceae bacterium]|nr:MBL fold metallo-hydrolase [Oscillospiraceae bacterium]